jgi:acyl transferase domain-containing protein
MMHAAVWVFSGHGAQWPDMGRELFHSSPAFGEVVRNLEPIIHDSGWRTGLRLEHGGNAQMHEVCHRLDNIGTIRTTGVQGPWARPLRQSSLGL